MKERKKEGRREGKQERPWWMDVAEGAGLAVSRLAA